MLIPNHLLPHLIAVVWFVLCWAGYTRYASWRGRDTACLASVLHLYRQDWMRRMLLRERSGCGRRRLDPVSTGCMAGAAACIVQQKIPGQDGSS